MQTIWFTLKTFWECGIFVHGRHWVPIWASPNKNPEHWVSNELPWETFHTCHNSLLEELSAFWVTPLREMSWKFKPGFLGLASCGFFLLIRLYPFNEINDSHEYDIYAESCWVLLVTHQIWRWSWGPPIRGTYWVWSSNEMKGWYTAMDSSWSEAELEVRQRSIGCICSP